MKNLTQLGKKASIASSPDQAVLETVANPSPDVLYVIRFSCPEFTSLCPITHQPDFAYFVIDYIPEKTIIESKSLKLFLASFRNFGGFHEECTLKVSQKIIDACHPRWLRIGGYWAARGGIPLDIFYQTGPLPEGVWIPDHDR